MVESLPADVEDTGSCPGPGRSHMPQSGWAREPWPLSLHSATGEATTVRGSQTTKQTNKKRPQIINVARMRRKGKPCILLVGM